MITSKLTTKAQTTIPQPVRVALHLREGDEIAYAIEPGRVMLHRAQIDRANDDPFASFPNGTVRQTTWLMSDCKIWDLVCVPFPYTRRPIQQRRPALVVAAPQAPGAPALLWVLMVTSAANRGWPGDVAISDLAAAGLPAASVIRSAKIATIGAQDAERIARYPTPTGCRSPAH